ncbi:MAG: adenylate/guanylate cyclase domain-containing protein [Gemmataceae bacterium]
MPDLVALGEDPKNTWRKSAPAGRPVTLGRKPGLSEWVADWDPQISRWHATLEWKQGKLWVRRNPEATNQIFYQGAPADDFAIGPGEQFVIGKTTFQLEQDEPTPSGDMPLPLEELTCSAQELQEHRYVDAADRIGVLAKLPAMIRYSPSEQEFEQRVLEVLLGGIPRALGVAIVHLSGSRSSAEPQVQVRAALQRDGRAPRFKPSRRLVSDAVRRRRQATMHSWASGGADFTVSPDLDWAICAPLPDDPEPGFGVYVVGQNKQDLLLSGTQMDVPKDDLKFAALVADIFGALRQVRDLQKRLSILQSILSPKVLAALAKQDINDVLKPRETDITVLFCDLRGFSRITEEGEQRLQDVWDRVSEALGIMTRNILDKDGVIGDFQGDAAMGFWGWPQRRDDQVEMAARAALAIRKEFWQASLKTNHPLSNFACGLGIAHGKAFAGRLGTMDQIKVGVFGPVVNRAARLESMTKHFQVPILVDEETAETLQKMSDSSSLRINAENFRTRRLAKVKPYGMERTILVHQLLPARVEPGVLSEVDMRDYDAALEQFLSGAWSDARELLERLPYDGPSQLLKDYIARRPRPPEGWDGVIAMGSK